MQFRNSKIQSFLLIFAFVATLTCVGLFGVKKAEAVPNLTINYQGKITDNSGLTLPDGDYSIEFSLYGVATGGTAVWTETRTVTITDGLFSVMLGEDTAFPTDIFNQTLYLGVRVETDPEMSPRKIVGSVPSAFESQRLGGLENTSFLRSDVANATGTITNLNSSYLVVGGNATTSSLTITGLANSSFLAVDGHGNVMATTSPILSESDPIWSAVSTSLTTANFASPNISQWTNNAGYLTSYNESDPIWLAASTSYFKLNANNVATGENTFASSTFSFASNSNITLSDFSPDPNVNIPLISFNSIDLSGLEGGINSTHGGIFSDTILIGSATNKPTLAFINFDENVIQVGLSTTTGNLEFRGSNNNLYSFDNNLGIGTTTPAEKLVVSAGSINSFNSFFTDYYDVDTAATSTIAVNNEFKSNSTTSIIGVEGETALFTYGGYGYATSTGVSSYGTVGLFGESNQNGILGVGEDSGVIGFGVANGGTFVSRGIDSRGLRVMNSGTGVAGEFTSTGLNSVGLLVTNSGTGADSYGAVIQAAEGKSLVVTNASTTGYSVYSLGGLNHFAGLTTFGSDLIVGGNATTTGNLVVASGKGITLGGEYRTTWPTGGGGGGGDSFWATSSTNVAYPVFGGDPSVVIGSATLSGVYRFEVAGGVAKLGAGLVVTGNSTTTNLAITGITNSYLATNALGQVVATSAPAVVEVDPFYAAASSTILHYGTTTNALTEGNNNLFWTTNRFDARLAATTSLPNIGTLSGLYIIGSSTGLTTILGKTMLTNATTTNFAITGLTNSWLSVNGSGSVVATTSPQPAGDYLTSLTGDVTATGPGQASATIANDAISFAKMLNGNYGGIIGRNTSGTGDYSELSTSTYKTMLALVKGDVGLSLVDNTADANKNVLSATKWTTTRAFTTSGDVVVTSANWDGSGNFTSPATIANSAVTLAKMANLAYGTIIGRSTNSTGAPEAISTSTYKTMLSLKQADIAGLTTASTPTFAGANLNGAVTINESGSAVNFRVESDTNENMLFVNGTTNMVGIGTASPTSQLTVYNSTPNDKTIYWSGRFSRSYNTAGFGGGVGVKFDFDKDKTNTKIAGIVGVSEDILYDRTVGLALYTSALDAAPTEKLRITGEGNVGIGTTSPDYFLTVLDNTSSKDLFRVGNATNPNMFKIDSLGMIMANVDGELPSGLTNGNSFIFSSPNGKGAFTTTYQPSPTTDGGNSGGFSFVENATSSWLIAKRTSLGITNAEAITEDSNSLWFGFSTSLSGAAGSLSVALQLSTSSRTSFGSGMTGFEEMISVQATSTGPDYDLLGLYNHHGDRKFFVSAAGNVQIPNGGFCVDNDGTCTTPAAGKIYADDFLANAGDLAENYSAFENGLTAGDIVSASNNNTGNFSSSSFGVRKATDKNKMIGIISTDPGVLLAVPEDNATGTENLPVALSGRVPVKVNLEGGNINIGDPITLSSMAGVGMKAVSSAETVGTALTSFDGNSPKDVYGVGEITVFVNLGYTHIDSQISQGKIMADNLWILDENSGQIKAVASLDLSNFDIKNVKSITSASGNWSIGEDGTLVVKNIKADRLCLGETCVTETELKTLLNSANISSTETPIVVGESTTSPATTTEPFVEDPAIVTPPVLPPAVETPPVESNP